MTGPSSTDQQDDRVSRRRYNRERAARMEAEELLEKKSRELFLANQELSRHSQILEDTVLERTADLRRALEKAESSSAARSRFIATMSHEIRTPLGGLLGMIDLLLGDETDPAKRKLLSYAKTSGDALRRIVNDVLDFSKMEAGVFHFENESVDIRALIDSIMALARTNIADGKTRLSSVIDPTVPRLFKGDATRIRQVISNLVSNAGRYSTEGPITIRATATARAQDALLRVEVEDHGIGIDPEQQESLFKDFTQVPNKLTAAAQGTGLGLAISKRIVEGSGGVIGFDSQVGTGSTFWFELPVEVIEAYDPNKKKKAKARVPMTQNGLVDGARIMLAEDNPINQKLLLTYLKRMKVDVELAENGLEAVEKFAPGRYDLIIMDVAMPVMDGFDAARTIRATWSDDAVPPIVILTAHVMESIHEESESVGVDQVLCKPISFDDLKSAISETLDRHAVDPKSVTRVGDHQTRDQAVSPVTTLMDSTVSEGLSSTMSVSDLNQLVTDYLEDGRQILDAIVKQHAAENMTAVSDQAHALKGASGLLGFSEIAELAEVVEHSASDLDKESIDEIETTITGHFEKIAAVLGKT